MSLFVAFVLGVVQGVFMFFPVSSTSHLVLTQTLLRSLGQDLPPPESAEMVLFDLLVHVGTLVSIAVVMGAGLRALGAGVVDDLTSGRLRAGGLREAVSTRLIALGLLTTAVTGVLGLLFVDQLTTGFGSPTAIAVALIGTGAMLWWTDKAGPGRLRAPDVGIGVAIAIGVAQFAALMPGLSRSGTTIFAALLVGMHRKLAARYSFFVAIPTILGASALQLRDVLDAGGLVAISWSAMAVGMLTAAVVGAGALWAVLRLLEQARFRIFSLYVWLLAGVILVTGFGAEAG
ncbi:undecaprenyl-diphosphate phosphatase [Egicoccus halophilus]|uniref:Undecaprenyl-diphosphatase n=1 Tax=Egicoccus halophilus TaxID=1670830 RepID=A0A8J3ABX3_9ACTN|nr:undecaprenyl-diphosphate phosphatase [Egicoccus halophilus]GGI02903.1 undecaprenyl-diphosphatase [Egicoccus halophilus]